MISLLRRQSELFEELNPDRIYIENVRAFFRIPYKLARFFCEMAVRDKVFLKKYGLYCPNEECGRLIKSFKTKNEIDEYVSCHVCKSAERNNYNFDIKDVEIIEFYQLNKNE